MLTIPIAVLRLTIGLFWASIGAVLGGLWFGLIPPELPPGIGQIGVVVVAGIGLYTPFVIHAVGKLQRSRIVPQHIGQALDALSEGILVLDERGRIVMVNRSFQNMVQLEHERLLGTNVGSLPWVFGEGNLTGDLPWNLAINQAISQVEQLIRYRLPDCQSRVFAINASPVHSSESQSRGAIVTLRDVTSNEARRAQLEKMVARLKNARDVIDRKNRELEVLATQDSLTGCLNRRALEERMSQAWQLAQQENFPVTCLMIDNDHFKQVNDTYGHQIGDDVLSRIGQLLIDQFAELGTVFRYGGEEFCVVMPGFDSYQSLPIAESIRAEIEAIRLEHPRGLRISVSIGVADSQLAADAADLIHQADQCLYRAKQQGRNCVVIDAEMAPSSAESG